MRCSGMKKSACLLLGLACCAALAGCQRETSNPAASNAANAVSEPLPDADINASLEAIGPGPDAADAATPRFVGRWAVDEVACADSAWEFGATRLETPAGSVCRFTEVREVPGGYDVSARCTAEAPERDDVLKLRFPESAEGMLFESDSIADAGLRACPG